MENLDALNLVISALGGTKEGKTNADAIQKIAAEVPDAILPSTAGANAGDVLTGVDGKWKAQAPSGGGASACVVTFESDDDAWAADKTYAEVLAAIEGQTPVLGVVMDGSSVLCCPILDYWSDGTIYFKDVQFYPGADSKITLALGAYTLASDESVSANTTYVTLTPDA